MKHKFYLLTAIIVMLIFICGCGLQKQDETPKQQNSKYKVMDDQGTEFIFTEAPNRIITNSLSYQDILMELVPLEHFAAVSAGSLDANYSLTADKAKLVKQKFNQPITLETVLAYKPDVYITTDSSPKALTISLKEMGVKVFIVKSAHNYGEIQHSVLKLAELTGQQAKGEAIIQRMDEQRDLLKKKLAKLQPKDKRTVVELTYAGTYGMLQHVFAMLCDLSNCNNGMEIMPVRSSMVVSKEKLVSLNPDVLFLPTWDAKGNQNSDQYFEQIISDPAYKDMQCIKNKRVYKFPEKYRYCASQYIVDAAEAMAKLVYPECFN